MGRRLYGGIFISLVWRHLSGGWELEHFSQQVSVGLSLSVSVSWTGLCWTEDTLTDWESTWRSQTKFCIFFSSIFINWDIYLSTINLSEILIILKYLSIFTRCYINQKIALVILFVGENSFYRYLNGHKSTSSLLFAYLFPFCILSKLITDTTK